MNVFLILLAAPLGVDGLHGAKVSHQLAARDRGHSHKHASTANWTDQAQKDVHNGTRKDHKQDNGAVDNAFKLKIRSGDTDVEIAWTWSWTWREDLGLIVVLLLLCGAYCYYSTRDEVEELTMETIEERFVDATEWQGGMVKNPVVLKVLTSLVRRHRLYAFALATFLLCCGILNRHYERLKTEHLELKNYGTKMRDVHAKEQQDFGMNYGNTIFGSVMIWSDEWVNVVQDSTYPMILSDINSLLQTLQDQDSSCSSLKWEAYDESMPDAIKGDFISDQKDAVVVRLSLNERWTAAAVGQRVRCFVKVRHALTAINDKYRLHVRMASTEAVIDASLQEAQDENNFHIALSAPFMVLLLMVGVGTPFRASLPCIVCAASVLSMRATMVLVKWTWKDLNFSGPESIALFVMLALCFDYALFFWSRLQSERRSRPYESLSKAVFHTLTTSGYIILVSMLAINLANISVCFYPNSNNGGYLGETLMIVIGIVFVGVYSLVVPACMVLEFPSLFDEVGSVWGFRTISDFVVNNVMVRPSWLKSLGAIVTRRPWIYIIPAGIFLCSAPLLYALWNMQLCYNSFLNYASTQVPEYAAHEVYAERFDMDRLNPVSIFLEALPMDTHSQLLSKHATDDAVALSPEFGRATCQFVDSLLKETHGTSYQVNATDVLGVWWNPMTGKCVDSVPSLFHSLKGKCLPPAGPCLSFDGRDQMMLIYKNANGPRSSDMVEKFWTAIDPQARQTFKVNNRPYQFQATIDTATSEEMLLERKQQAMLVWIVGISVVMVIGVVGFSFGSAFVAFKLIFTVFIPILAEYGLIVGIYQRGWLEWLGIGSADQLHVGSGIPWEIIFTTSPLLFALAIDYDIFLFSRAYELRLAGYDNRSAVRLAFEETGPTITLAGTLMMVAFFFIYLSHVPILSISGFLYFVGVGIDTYIIRLWIAPAALCMYEEMNYWPMKMPEVTKDYEDYDDPARPYEVKEADAGAGG